MKYNFLGRILSKHTHTDAFTYTLVQRAVSMFRLVKASLIFFEKLDSSK